MSKMDLNARLSEVLAHPVGRNMLNQYLPQLAENASLQNSTLTALIGLLPEEAGALLRMLPAQCNAYRGHAQAFAKDYYELTQVMEGVWRLYSPEDVRMELIVGRDRALLLDTGYGYGDISAAVRKVTDKPLIVVNSHGHMDHTCGNCQFDLPIHIHPKDMALCRRMNDRETRERSLTIAEHSYDYYSGESYSVLPADFDREAYLSAGAGNLIPMEEGHVFDLGGVALEVIALPGHTPGSIGLWDRKRKLLFVGDAINSYLWLFMPEALMLSDYRATLAKAEELDFVLMFQAHNPRVESKEVLKYYREIAETLDYEKGEPFQSPLTPGAEAKVCIRQGKTLQNFRDPDFAAIVIGKEHLN